MRRQLLVLLAILFAGVTAVLAQTTFGQWGLRSAPYDGEFTFVRLRWTRGTFAAPPVGPGNNFWIHEFPLAERNLMAMVKDLTLINAKADGSLNLALDDPQLFRHPIAVMWEPGFWIMTDAQAERLREYLQKGGFLIFNDFELEQWDNFEAQTRRIIPGARWIRLDRTHPIFDSFFRIASLDMTYPGRPSLPAEFYGIYEDNDPKKRLMVIINYNNDIGDYLEHSGRGRYPVNLTNDAYKFAVNYILYGMTR
jgi:hypothetical protein